MSPSFDEKNASSDRESVPEDGVRKFDPRIAEELQAEEDAHVGVKAVEAAEKVYGKYSKWFLFVGIALASYIYSLDGQTTYNYLAYAASDLDKHSLISTIQVAESTIIACGKPVIAKFADVRSRSQAYIVVLTFYVIGYIVIASAHTFGALAAGLILYSVGYTGLQLLTSVIVADITTLKWRGFVSGMTSSPFIINAFVGSNVASQVYSRSGWRWGYGMFAVLVPAALAPLIVTLTWAERKAKKLGLVPARAPVPELAPGTPLSGKVYARVVSPAWTFAQQLDVIGLALIGTSVALILLPLTLAQSAKSGWKNPSMIAMLVIGLLLIPGVALWEVFVAKRPVLARRLLKNRTVMIAAWIGFFDFFSFYLCQTYLYSYITIVKDWTLVNINYFNQAQSVALTVFGISAGIIMRFTHHYKIILIVGLAIRLFGVGLMIHSRGAHASDAEVVMTQLIQGLGGGFASVCSSVAAQASVPHADMAIATAMVLLWTEIGGAVGSAVAGAIWTNEMPKKLAEHIPSANATEIATLFSSISSVAAYPFGNPVREGAIAAYGDVMKLMLIAATVLAAVPFLLAFGLQNWYLGDQQNAVEATDLKGERAPDAEKSSPV